MTADRAKVRLLQLARTAPTKPQFACQQPEEITFRSPVTGAETVAESQEQQLQQTYQRVQPAPTISTAASMVAVSNVPLVPKNEWSLGRSATVPRPVTSQQSLLLYSPCLPLGCCCADKPLCANAT